jgi:hypothetical protein
MDIFHNSKEADAMSKKSKSPCYEYTWLCPKILKQLQTYIRDYSCFNPLKAKAPRHFSFTSDPRPAALRFASLLFGKTRLKFFFYDL